MLPRPAGPAFGEFGGGVLGSGQGRNGELLVAQAIVQPRWASTEVAQTLGLLMLTFSAPGSAGDARVIGGREGLTFTDDPCQAPEWGYMSRGRERFR